MPINRSKLYGILLIASTAGYIWLFYNINATHTQKNYSFEICLMKKLTNIPCPSCGTTRSVISIFNGHYSEAMHINPIGILIAFALLIIPVWIFLDILIKKDSFLTFYSRIENTIKKPSFAIILIFFVAANWIWNINKGL